MHRQQNFTFTFVQKCQCGLAQSSLSHGKIGHWSILFSATNLASGRSFGSTGSIKPLKPSGKNSFLCFIAIALAAAELVHAEALVCHQCPSGSNSGRVGGEEGAQKRFVLRFQGPTVCLKKLCGDPGTNPFQRCYC